MKEVNITQFSHAEVDAPLETFGFAKIPLEHKIIRAEGENLEVSDGYHTFDELYEHRIRLFIEVCKLYRSLKIECGTFADVWTSKIHHDGSSFDDWFILGINKEKGNQMTYHLPARFWNEVCEFADVLQRAPEWDGHTPADVLERLKSL